MPIIIQAKTNSIKDGLRRLEESREAASAEFTVLSNPDVKWHFSMVAQMVAQTQPCPRLRWINMLSCVRSLFRSERRFATPALVSTTSWHSQKSSTAAEMTHV